MLAFDDARSRLLENAHRVACERVALREASGRVLAESLVAQTALPRFDHSAMDGYALASGDLKGEGPWVLRVVGESRAGVGSLRLESATACRIFTGAAVPDRADCVVMQENATREGEWLRFEVRPKVGQHIRRAGEDVVAGATALPSGTRLSAGSLALAAMLDRAELVVARRPRVTLVCTGDELRAPGSGGGDALIPESNSAPLAALARQAGATVRVAPIVGDDPAATSEAFAQALEGTDLLLTVGGVSVGDHDVVRPALERAGVSLQFWKVAIRPGKPLAVGRAKATHVLGLPGNPSSAMVTFVLFGMPLLRAMQGDARPIPTAWRVRLAAQRRRATDRIEFARAGLVVRGDSMVAVLCDNQASGAATSLAHSDGLAVLPPGEGVLPADTPVDFLRWTDA